MRLLIIQVLIGSSLYCSVDNHSFEDERKKEQSLILLATSFASTSGAVETPGLSSQVDTPNSTKRRSAFSSNLSPLDLGATLEQDSEVLELESKIEMLQVTCATACELGQELLFFKKENPTKNARAVQLIERFHNKIAAPLREFFKNESGEFNKIPYDEFLEDCLPHMCDDLQNTPLRLPNETKRRKQPKRRSVFEESDSECES